MKIVEEIEGFFSSKLGVIKAVITIIKLETRLAGLSVFPLLLTMCMLFVVLIATWLSSLLLLGYFAKLMFDNIILAIVAVLLLNVGLFLGLLKYLAFNLKKMSFEKTRAYISNKESNEHDKQEKTINRSNSNDGKDITLPTK